MQRHLTIIAFVAGILATSLALPGHSAEEIVASYGLLEFSIPVESLETFANEGHIDRDLANYARHLDEEQLEQLRQYLNEPIPLSAVEVSQLTYSYLGEESLRFLGNIIRTGAWQNGFHSLRGGLVLAAIEPEGLTLLNVMKQFPTSTLRIDTQYAWQIARDFTQLFEHNEQSIDLIAQLANQEAEDANYSTAIELDISGNSIWQKDVLSLFDESRERHITVDFYQPNTTSPAPLIVVSHGLAASRDGLGELAEHLASHGLAVAVVEHPNSNFQQVANLLEGLAQEVAEPSEFIDRPLDISYLLDELDSLNQSGSLQTRLNLQQIGVVGHSFGGYTALALVGADFEPLTLNQTCNPTQFNSNVANVSLLLQCSALQLPDLDTDLHDERIQAAFVFNPIGSALFGESGLQQINAPVFVVAGSEDWVAPALLEQICPFTRLESSNKYLALIQGGGHGYAEPTVDQNRLLNELTGSDPTTAKRYLKALSLAFFNTHIREQSEYQAFLSAGYAQSLNQSPLELHLIKELSDTQIAQSTNFECSDIAKFFPN
ncbi:alpha/beta hydrolase [Vacuolonema iberomarrocanum]|uniref:alpha/beta hydrolase n=1 Tax=Vacuolonema iberomarrocanum TaxID=3454632 RepID=UPI0019F7EC85|nr:alpha/beta hydrolase [filamentous cyanobacterium LEGE 07170]